MPTCVIKGCKNRPEMVQQNKSLTLTFHRFPVLNPTLMSVWLKSIGTANLKDPKKPIHKTTIICSEHFETKYFKYAGMRTRILPEAVPTIFKAVKDPPNLIPSYVAEATISAPVYERAADRDTGLANIEEMQRIANVQIPSIEAGTKKSLEVPSVLLVKDEPKSPRKILPAEPQKKTFVFLRNRNSSTTVELPQIPAKEMKQSRSGAKISEKSSSRLPTNPFELTDELTEKQSVICVVGLDPNAGPEVKIFTQATSTTPKNFSLMCRVCLSVTNRTVPIFHGASNSALADKIHKHLSITVTCEDQLPLQVCLSCVQILNEIEILSAKSYENELKLKLMLEMGNCPDNKPTVLSELAGGSKEGFLSKEPNMPFRCQDCNKSMTTFKSYARHCYVLHKKKKCKWCDTLLADKEEMLQHRIEAHGSSCAACGLKFKGINSMLKHMRQEHPDFKSNTCEICGKSFISKYSLGVHYEVHSSSKPFLCDACGKSFKSRRKLKSHRCDPAEEELARNTNECDICGKRYTFRSSLKRHLLRHTGNKNFQCHVCCKRFYGATNLKNHMVVHERATVYECQMCCARYYHKRNMITHLKDKHSTRWHYKCPYCSLLFPSIDEVVKHRDEDHECPEEVKRDVVAVDHESGIVEEFRCKICERQFENIYALTHHFEEHVIHGPEDLNIKTIGLDGLLECALCGANLTSTWAMRCHIKKTHLNLQQRLLVHTCAHCSKQFATKSQLRRHMMQHTGEKPFHCATCDAGFRSRAAHKIHMRIHTGETPFHCQKCPKKFRSSAILKNHEGVHVRPFACGLCLQRFSSKSALKSHMDLHERKPGQMLHLYDKNLLKNAGTEHLEMSSLEAITPQLVTEVQDQGLGQTDDFNSAVETTYFAL